MNFSEDLHVCGICKSVFSELEKFTDHKSSCSQQKVGLPSKKVSSSEDLLERELISSERALDLAILESGAFPFVLQFDNEEVISETTQLGLDEHSNEAELKNILKTNKIIDKIDEEDVASLLVNQLSREVVMIEKCQPSLKNKKQREVKDRKKLGGIKRNELDKSLEEDNTLNKQVSTLEKKPFHTCSLCNFKSSIQRDLLRHMRKHTGERPYVCVVCEKRFARPDNLATHKRIHFGDKRYKCQLCDYATTDSGGLNKHIKTHMDDRPHKCQVCSYRARSTSHLVVHLRTHTGDSPFFCSVKDCRRRFKTSSDLKRHLNNHKMSTTKLHCDNDHILNSSCKNCLEERKLSLFTKTSFCYACQDFKQKERIRGRRGGAGGKVRCKRSFKCIYCDAGFVREDSLRSHLRLHPETSLSLETETDERLQENKTKGCESSSWVGSHDTSEQVEVQIHEENADCLEESFIPSLEQDIIVQSIMDTSFL